MHPSYGSGQNGSTYRLFPPGVRPGCPETEENTQRNQAGCDSNDRSADHVRNSVSTRVVRYSVIAEVVHATDSSPREYTPKYDVDWLRFACAAEEIERHHEDQYWKEKRECCEPWTVAYLVGGLSVTENDRTIGNEVHCPNP
jgi:hypothetical protein